MTTQNQTSWVRPSIGQVARSLTNPIGALGTAAVVGGGTFFANRQRSRNAPERIGSQVGSASDIIAANLNPWQQRQMDDWDEEQLARYQNSVAQSSTNAVRQGQLTPEQARANVAQASFGNPAELAQSQMGGMTAADLPDATSQLGDYNGLGLDNEYWSQLRNASILQGNLTEDMGDQMISREFDRTARYRLPLENYRMSRDFAYGQKGEQNTMKRNMAAGLLNSYANTAQQLMTSGL
jgi:hypothetical protein